jgi:hypothetical protein
MYGGVLFGVAVLAGIYFLNTRSRDKGKPAAPPPVVQQGPGAKPGGVQPGGVPADPKEAVLGLIRTSRATVNAELVRWWPPKRVAFNGPERMLCRIIFRVKERKDWSYRDAVGPFKWPSRAPKPTALSIPFSPARTVPSVPTHCATPPSRRN